MARGPRRVVQRIVEVESQSPAAATVEKILIALKPDRDITPSEFLKRAFTFPQIDKIKIQKFSVGTWNFAEDLDNLGPSDQALKIEEYLKEKYGAWRFRLCAVVNGEVITQHVINLDGWQQSEARAASESGSTRGPVLSPNAKPAGPGATSELLAMARERIEIENTQRLLMSLATGNGGNAAAPTQIDIMTAPVKAMMEMMTGMMAAMKEMVTVSRGGMGTQQEDRFLSYLQSEIQFLREQMKQPAAARDPDMLSKTVATIDGLLQSTLNTSLAELLTKTPAVEATGWTATIQGVIEGIKPYLPDIMAAVKGAATPARPALMSPRANVVPIRPTGQPVEPTEGDEMAKGVSKEILEVVDLLIESLKKKDFGTVDVLLSNPPLFGQVNIDPNVAPVTYAIMLANLDPRFRQMAGDIGAYLEHMKAVMAAEANDEKGN